jgi:acylphosphatase
MTTTGVLARKYVVRGRVQGVGFRYFVEREARALNVSGWVRNTEESTVELVAVGTEEQQIQLRERLRQGPRASRVDSLDEQEAAADDTTGHMKDFRIVGAW